MPKRLNERLAWLRLAGEWRAAETDKNGYFYAGNHDYGVCLSISSLHWSDLIDATTWARMRKQLDKLPERNGLYCWPLDAKGAKARVRFCLSQARRLAPKKKKVKA